MPDSLEFKAGYLMACVNLGSLHGETSMASEILEMAGIAEADIQAMDLCEYDQEGLDEIRRDLSTDPIRVTK